MAWCHPGDKPLSEPVMVSLLMHICLTQPIWVKGCYKSIVAFEITGILTICSTVGRTSKETPKLTLLMGIHWWSVDSPFSSPVDSPHKGPVTWKYISMSWCFMIWVKSTCAKLKQTRINSASSACLLWYPLCALQQRSFCQLSWDEPYSISQEICTRFCCALLCCGYAIVHNEFTWSLYPYSSGLLCWHWGNRQIACVPVK